MLIADFLLFRQAKRFKPDIFISFASPYAAQVSWLLHKPHIVLDDTEHAKFGHMFYKPFSSVFLNPFCFYKSFGHKQIFFKSFVENLYLHPKYFIPDKAVYSYLGIRPEEKYVILRFVSWKANHDIGHSGLDEFSKVEIINYLKIKYKIFISSEDGSLGRALMGYKMNIPPELIHHALHFAEFFITESGTMASEAAILNTPVIYVNSLPFMGYLKEEMKAGLLFHYINSTGVLQKVRELVNINNIKDHFKSKNNKLLSNLIDPTAFLVWFVKNYPESEKIMHRDPDFQNRFR